jgi:hypothetical protein
MMGLMPGWYAWSFAAVLASQLRRAGHIVWVPDPWTHTTVRKPRLLA